MQPDILMIDEALGAGEIEFEKKSARADGRENSSRANRVVVSTRAILLKTYVLGLFGLRMVLAKWKGKLKLSLRHMRIS